MFVPVHSCKECERWQEDVEDTHNGIMIVYCSDDKTRCVDLIDNGCAEIIPKGW